MMYKEIWKQIPGYSDYAISNLGRICSLENKKILEPYISHLKYRRIRLKGQRSRVGRLVLLTFIGPCPKNMEMSHLNGNSLDDRLENLKWETQLNNQRRRKTHKTDNIGERNGRSKLKEKDIVQIRELSEQGFIQEKIGQIFNISQSHISKIIRNKNWGYVYDN